MRMNTNHPSFVTFLDNVTKTILTYVSTDNYFQIPKEKKIGVQFAVLKLMKNAIKTRIKLNDDELKSFVVLLCKKNESIENYEFAGILHNIVQNFDSINEMTKTTKRTTKKIKTDVTEKE